MKRNTRRALSALLSVLMLLSLLVIPAGAETKPTVWLVGDSTVCNYELEGRYIPRNGYGQALGNYLDSTKYTVNNLAISGTSSQSFLDSENYTTLTAGISTGDYLIIGFGHNDEKTDEDRGTLPTVDNWATTEDSMGSYLNTYYIQVAKNAGATPILCTPIVRRSGSDNYTLNSQGINNNLHVTTDGDYPAAIKKVGADTNTSVIDMTTLTKTEWQTETDDYNKYLHSWENSLSPDNTHLNAHGAKMVAWLLADAICSSDDSALADLAAALTPGTKPAMITSKEDDLWTAMINDAVPAAPEGYQPRPNGADKTLGDKTWFSDYYPTDNENAKFYGTAFGSLGSTSMDYYTAERVEDDKLHLAVTEKKGGKITATEDGLLMYYYAIPASATSYSLSAVAHVDSLLADGQAAFGLMARDDIYINIKLSDESNKVNTAYVAAGTLGTWQTNCFAKPNTGGVLNTNTELSGKSYAAGQSIPLSISFGGDNYVAQFGNETAKTYDEGYSMKVVDPEYVYIGMFIAREADVTFSDIVLTVDGEVICDTTTEFSFQVTDCAFEDADGRASDTAVEGGKLASVTGALVGSPDDALVFAAVYDQAGKMTGVKAITPKTGEIPVGLPVDDGSTAKVFVLNRTTVSPYTAAFSSAAASQTE